MDYRTINFVFSEDSYDMEKLLSFDFPEDGHEPDESGLKATLKDGDFDNAGGNHEMQIRIRKDDLYVDFNICDLIAMAQFGYKKWKEQK